MLLEDGLAPTVVVTDHLMSGMSGVQLAQQLRSERSTVPMLIISGYAEADGIDPAVARLTKPFRISELAASLFVLVPPVGG